MNASTSSPSAKQRPACSVGLRADEAKAINLSLTTLGLCINSRADRTSKHTPFRDSKLTRLLQVKLPLSLRTKPILGLQSMYSFRSAHCLRDESVEGSLESHCTQASVAAAEEPLLVSNLHILQLQAEEEQI